MKKYDNFCVALQNLHDIYDYEEPYNTVVLNGMVALYGICFEQSWKAIREVLKNHGFAEGQIGTPRQSLKTAYQVEMIQDEDIWLRALMARNNVAYAYNQKNALDIVKQTKESYYQMFCELKEEIDKKWL